MTGFVLATGTCVACRQVFGFNPMRVPSTRRTPEGPREPICSLCVPRINLIRKQHGLPLIVPLPDAYEACEESELD